MQPFRRHRDDKWNATYAAETGTLMAIFGYRKLDQQFINQYNTNGTALYNSYILTDATVNRPFSGELKWSSSLEEDRLKYGGRVLSPGEEAETAMADFQSTVAGASAFNLLQDRHFHQKVETAAIYLQADYEAVPGLISHAGGPLRV